MGINVNGDGARGKSNGGGNGSGGSSYGSHHQESCSGAEIDDNGADAADAKAATDALRRHAADADAAYGQ